MRTSAIERTQSIACLVAVHAVAQERAAVSYVMTEPKKPTGQIGPVRLSNAPEGARAEFLPVEFPRSKAEIEKQIVNRFLAQACGTQVFPFFGCTVNQNAESDIDFTLSCFDKKPRKLELMEIAPLEHLRGTYTKAPKSYKPYDFAKYIVEKVMAKSNKYGRPKDAELHLLTYITDWRFILSDSTIGLIDYWLLQRRPNFMGVYLYMPMNPIRGHVVLLYPTGRSWSGFNPETVKESVVHNLDPTAWRANP